MQVLSKVIRLDLQYSSQQSHLYQRQTCYLAPFYHEEALHFAKRILAYLSLFELKPELAKLTAMVKEEMEKALPLKVPVLVEAGSGNNWLEAH